MGYGKVPPLNVWQALLVILSIFTFLIMAGTGALLFLKAVFR